jgi:hypothetical protein
VSEEVRQQVADYLNSIVEREIARRKKEKSNKKYNLLLFIL